MQLWCRKYIHEQLLVWFDQSVGFPLYTGKRIVDYLGIKLTKSLKQKSRKKPYNIISSTALPH